MTAEIPKAKRVSERRRQRERAYALLLEETDAALEVQFNGEWHYVAGIDKTLYHAKTNDDPEEIRAPGLELLCTGERVGFVPIEQCHEFGDLDE